MKRTNLTILLASGLVLYASSAYADVPKDQSVTYNIRNDPPDEASPIIWTVTLDISAERVDGETVKWHVDAIHITDHGSPMRAWNESDPIVDTPDGYWYVTHADHDTPQTDEFDEVPPITGTADNALPSGVDLDYDFLCEVLLGTPPWSSDFSSMTYSFTLVGESTPEAEGDDEAAEIDELDDA